MNYLERELKIRLQNDDRIFKFIRESSLDGLWYWDIENPENKWMDEKFWTTLGYDPKDMPHKFSTWQNIIFEEDLKIVLDNFNKHCADPKHPYDQIVRYQHKSGLTVWVRCRGMAIRDENGKPLRMLGAHTDITALKEKEETLQQCNKAASIGYWKYSLNDNKLFWGNITRKILEVQEDYSPEPENALTFFGNEQNKRDIKEASIKAIDTGHPYEMTLPMVTAKGNTRWVHLIGIPEMVNGNCIGIYGSIQDIHKHKMYELNLAKEKEKLKNVIKGTNVGTWEWNVQTGETAFNERWANIIGYTLKELQPVSVETGQKFTHPDDRKRSRETLQECLDRKSDYYECEYRMKHKHGHWVWILDRGKVFNWTADGKPLMMFGTHQDISESKKATEKQNLFIKHAPAALAMFDTDMHYISASQKWINDFGVDENVLQKQTLVDTFKEAKAIMEEVHQVCLSGESHSEDELLFVRNGKDFWLKWEASPWMTDEAKIGGFIMSAEDITAQKETEEKLRISETSFAESFENSAVGVALVSKEGHWIKVNKKLCETLGYSSNELKELTFQDITHPDDLQADISLYEEVLSGHRDSYQLEKRYFHKNGETIHTILAVSVVRDRNEDILYFISQIIDISELKNAEKRIQALLATSQDQNNRLQNFAHIVSHNLKSHSGNIDFMIDIITDEMPELKNQQSVKLLKVASKNLAETISHLNEVAVINTSTHENLKPISLYHTVEKAVGNVSAIAESAGVQIINKVNPKTKIIGLNAYLDSIILNFLTNGIKYRSGKEADFVKISNQDAGDYTIIIVEDNGLGIDLEKNGHELFGMYKTFHRHPESRGIGLFITKSQIEALGGKVEVESELKKGSTFKIYLKHEKN